MLWISYKKRGKINGKLLNFARVYDELMDNVPYEEWADFILAILKKNKITDGLVLELGCGTGKLMSLLGNAGFDMIGVDNSVDMLQIAREKTSPGVFVSFTGYERI